MIWVGGGGGEGVDIGNVTSVLGTNRYRIHNKEGHGHETVHEKMYKNNAVYSLWWLVMSQINVASCTFDKYTSTLLRPPADDRLWLQLVRSWPCALKKKSASLSTLCVTDEFWFERQKIKSPPPPDSEQNSSHRFGMLRLFGNFAQKSLKLCVNCENKREIERRIIPVALN